mgnify:CR=1 FL=1
MISTVELSVYTAVAVKVRISPIKIEGEDKVKSTDDKVTGAFTVTYTELLVIDWYVALIS